MFSIFIGNISQLKSLFKKVFVEKMILMNTKSNYLHLSRLFN